MISIVYYINDQYKKNLILVNLGGKEFYKSMSSHNYRKDELKTIRAIIKWFGIILTIFMITATIIICVRSVSSITITYHDISLSANMT